MNFGKITKMQNKHVKWTAHLDRMTIEHSQFVDAEQYLNDFAEFCEGEEE